ncbi:MAG: CtsR family transcriptional regulator [Clostridiales bacterium]|nr:CtsR family transcriptional regulator [Clostridiales bacterium]
MAKLSDLIEDFIKKLILDTDGVVELQRNELANKFNCVPSQINYVIGTRFSGEQGYYVESRRGGGGYIKIQRVSVNRPSNYLMHIVTSMGNSMSEHSAEIFINNFVDYEIVTLREGLLMKAATSNKPLGNIPLPFKDEIRAAVLKNMLLGLAV